MTDTLQYKQVVFKRFKAFKSFKLTLHHFNIMVGPNNAGKSTVLAAFRILDAGLRRARTRKPVLVNGPEGRTLGHLLDLAPLSVGEENIFYDYDDSQPASVTFTLTDNKKLVLHFPVQGSCVLVPHDPYRSISTPAQFRLSFNAPIGFVPVLGPVEHHERLYEREAARLALSNYRAARNFRNIWYHYPDHFDSFRNLVRQTWPGMDIGRPEVDTSHQKPVLHMFCPEQRIPREICWAGFGFQVWCQMLTHIVQSRNAAIFLIDEPDIYLHSDLQRQLLSLLQELGPDILIATHSTEIVSEAAPDDIVLIDKNRSSARRIKDPTQLNEVFTNLGSNLNPILTQLAKTRRAVFVEGEDFQVFAKYARRIGYDDLANRRSFAVIPVGGSSLDRIRSLKRGIEIALGEEIKAAVILDRDFRSDAECDRAKSRCREFCELSIVHTCKEVENFLLVPAAIERAAHARLQDRARHGSAVADSALNVGSEAVEYVGWCANVLEDFAEDRRSHVMSQHLASRRRFARLAASGEDEATTGRAAIDEFFADWAKSPERRLELIPGKEALAAVNRHLQEHHQISVTITGIVSAIKNNEIPKEVRELLDALAKFAAA